jgi:hypothetical protein
MKKILFATLLLSASFGLLGSCSKGEAVAAAPLPVNCEANKIKTTNLANTYFRDNTESSCQAYLNANNDLLKKCPGYAPYLKYTNNVVDECRCRVTYDQLEKSLLSVSFLKFNKIECQANVSAFNDFFKSCPNYLNTDQKKLFIEYSEAVAKYCTFLK